jgi:phospholipase/carboxylesterase
MTAPLRCVEAGAAAGHADYSVIWLHGLGADGHDFQPIVPQLGLDRSLKIRFVFPTANRIPVTLNMGAVMPAWYDIKEMDLRRRHDESGIRASADQIETILRQEKNNGVPAERIILAGFSQGGAIALHVGLRHAERLAGIMLLSTYFVLEETAENERNEANNATPIFQAHGQFDPMVTPDRGEAAPDALTRLGYQVEWHSYPMEHQVHPAEIQHIGEWIQRCFTDAGTTP